MVRLNKIYTRTGDDGKYHFKLSMKEVLADSVDGNLWRWIYVVARKDDHGIAFKPVNERDRDGNLDLTLPKDDVPIEGRILDLEGRPVAGATIRVGFSADGNRAITGSFDQTARVWDVATANFIGRFGDHANLVNAVAGSNVEHFVLSSLASIEKETGGKLKSPHFDLKAEHEELAKTLGIPSTFVHVPFYYENFLAFFPPMPTGDGSFQISFPQGDTPLAAISVEDVGKIVAPIFEQPEKYIGKVIEPAGDDIPPAEYAAKMGNAAGVDVRYAHMPREAYAALGFPGADDLADMFEYYRLHIPSRKSYIEEARANGPELQSFDSWIGKNAAKLKSALKLA